MPHLHAAFQPTEEKNRDELDCSSLPFKGMTQQSLTSLLLILIDQNLDTCPFLIARET
jgi:hypothetical protein